MQNRLYMILTVTMMALSICLVGCGGGPGSKTGSETGKADSEIGSTGSGKETTTQEAEQGQEAEAVESSETTGNTEDVVESYTDQSKNGSIVVYFSRVGNTDFPKNVDASSSASIQADDGGIKGNAQMMAEWIAEEAGCDTFEIQVKDSYPVDYDETVEQARNEQSEKARPELKTETGDIDGYDTVYLVMPNWWGDLPMPVYSFFDACDLSGKKINVFITHEGSGFSDTIDTIKELEPEAEVVEGIDARGGSVAEEEESIKQWVSENK